jgi:cellulose synthase/poly-beta-1,6-N-acetylglucosamine synthase-like glycosyltransferase
MLKAMAESFEAGYGAVQLSYLFTVSQATHLSHLQHLASLSENLMFYRGRSALNLPILLRGSGMAVRADLLKKYPWDSFSITEDVDYAVDLLTHGVQIDFNSNSTVYSAATSTYQQSVTQKTRWASGTIQLVRDKMLRLVSTGILSRSPTMVELGFSLLLLSRPFLIYSVLGVLLINLIIGPPHQASFSISCLLLIGLLMLYILLGGIYARDKVAALKSLCIIPFYGLWFLFVQVLAIAKSGKLHWHRTERKT